jgi:hypothetical protein
MNEHEQNEFERRLARRVERLLEALEELVEAATAFLKRKRPPPSAPVLAGTFDSSGDSMNAVLQAQIPTTRGDLTALAPTAIASITYQKTTAAAPTTQVSLQVNSAVAGAGLQASDLAFTDTSSTPGDSYTCFVTDTNGVVGAVSNAVVNPVGGVVDSSAPSAPVLTATFA